MRTRQRGMSMIVAIFLIVVVASLAAFAVTAGTSQRESANLQLASDRAAAAARAGVEWGAYRALVQGNCPASTPLALNQAALRGLQVRVDCVRRTHAGVPLVEITAFARNGNFGAVNYASRTLVSRF
jgi:MSHA biogenesis protein MshP